MMLFSALRWKRAAVGAGRHWLIRAGYPLDPVWLAVRHQEKMGAFRNEEPKAPEVH